NGAAGRVASLLRTLVEIGRRECPRLVERRQHTHEVVSLRRFSQASRCEQVQAATAVLTPVARPLPNEVGTPVNAGEAAVRMSVDEVCDRPEDRRVLNAVLI